MSVDVLEEVFHPKSIAVVGASNNPASWGYSYTHHLLDYGFRGKIYPINPNYDKVLGVKAYPSLKDVPGSVDYVISCVRAEEILDMLRDCSQKGVKAVHLYTARFSETGRQEAAALEQAILRQARSLGIRLIGPNCMGIYYPREGLSFGYNLPKVPGSVGMASQTGGGASSFVYLASLRGVRFSKVVSYGNALDFNECDYLDYFARDEETNIILLYIEGVKDGKRFLNSLRYASAIKPVIVLKGGRGISGARVIASHTASLAGSMKVWEAAITQAGAISAQDFDEMADFAVSFYFLPPVTSTKVGVIGGGGGPSVLAAEACEEAGLDVIQLPVEIREEMKRNGITIWDWVGNPTDVSILGGSGLSDIDMLHLMARNRNFDLLIANLNESTMITLATKERLNFGLRRAVEGYIGVKEENLKPLLVVVREKGLDVNHYDDQTERVISEIRTKLIDANVPFYPTMRRAAVAASKMIGYYSKRK